MIRKTLQRTKRSTFIVNIPNKNLDGFPTPTGTGFFISPRGYFITAKHVCDVAEDVSEIHLNQPIGRETSRYVAGSLELVEQWKEFDIALLKADFESNPAKETFTGKQFPYLDIDFKEQKEGTPVYSYGFPLPDFEVQDGGEVKVGIHYICPRTTSAIISSLHEVIGPVASHGPPTHYVIDKALNYGNSGGPIVVTETGKVISVCVRFQPVHVQQNPNVSIMVPSLYGITSSLWNIKNYLDNIL